MLEVWFSGRLYVIAYGHDAGQAAGATSPRAQIAFGGSFSFTSRDGEQRDLRASDAWESLVDVLSLRDAQIVEATADRRGRLVLRFDDGAALVAEPDPQFENWEIAGPGRLNLVAPPGGGDPRITI